MQHVQAGEACADDYDVAFLSHDYDFLVRSADSRAAAP